MKKVIMHMIRYMATAALICFVWRETGIFTAGAMAMIFISVEILAHSIGWLKAICQDLANKLAALSAAYELTLKDVRALKNKKG